VAVRREPVLVGAHHQEAGDPGVGQRAEHPAALVGEARPVIVAVAEVERHRRQHQLERRGRAEHAVDQPAPLSLAEQRLGRAVGIGVGAAEPAGVEEEALERRAPPPAAIARSVAAAREPRVPRRQRPRFVVGVGGARRAVPVVAELVVVVDRAERGRGQPRLKPRGAPRRQVALLDPGAIGGRRRVVDVGPVAQR
jgi:hypothetical protein